MNTIHIRYEGLSPTWTGDAVSGQIGTLKCSFEFDESWSEYNTVYMVVAKGNTPYDPVKLDETNSAEVQEIALQERCILSIGAVGLCEKDGKIFRYNGRPCRIAVDQGNMIPDPNKEPDESGSETAYEQVLLQLAGKLNANQGTENAGRVLVVGEDGIVRPGEYAGGGGGTITQESDPTVPAWAKQPNKPSYTKSEVGLSNVDNVKQYSASNPPPYPVQSVNGKTGAVKLSASDVGADTSGTADSKVSAHNTSATSHNDIRLLISGLTSRLNALADSDDTTLDQMSELVAYIKANKSLIDSITTSKVSVADIVDNLTTSEANKPLSAAQGVALKKLIDALNTGKLDADTLPDAINTALAQAKESGEFDGAPGDPGAAGVGIASITQDASNADGGTNTIEVVLTDSTKYTFTVKNGSAGTPGRNGTSVTVSSVTESTEDGGSNVVTFSDGKKLTVKNGKTGATGKNAYAYAQDGGYTGTEEEFAQKLAAEYVPLNNITLGIHTDGLVYIFANGSPVGSGIKLVSAGDVVGTLDENNDIVLTGNLADGTYTLKYENADGSFAEIGNLVINTDTTVYYSVTNNLTYCTSSNSAAQVAEGSAYTAAITANSEYELSSVTVTMGGTDVTSSAVSGGNINIANVTGDIVITAVAEEVVEEVVNWITNSQNADGSLFIGTNGEKGYKPDTRLGTSDGGERSQSGIECTGFIPVVYTDTLYVKGVTVTNNSYETVVAYDSNHAKLAGTTTDTYFGTMNGEVKAVKLADIKAEPFGTAENRVKVAYIRISANTIDANSIITKNQPIE